MFISPVYYFFFKIIILVYNGIYHIIDNSGPFINKEVLSYVTEKFILDCFGDIFAIIGFLIYNEILELSFCNLDYNLRKNIIKRGEIDKMTSLSGIENTQEEKEVSESE